MRRSFLDDQYRPTGQGVLKETKWSMACGIFSIILFLLLIYISYRQQGNASKWIGFFGWSLVLITAIGDYYAIAGLKEPGGSTLAKMIALFVNSIPLIMLIFLYVIGMI